MIGKVTGMLCLCLLVLLPDCRQKRTNSRRSSPENTVNEQKIKNPTRLCTAYGRYGIAKTGSDQSPQEGAVLDSTLWDIGETIDIYFINGEADLQDSVKLVASEWMQHANIKFNWVKKLPASIRIAFDASGNWSELGTNALLVADGPTMNLEITNQDRNSEEFKGVILHEFGHALGMVHEHQQPNSQINWNKIKVYETYMGEPQCWDKEMFELNIFNKALESNATASDFDEHSIMIYAIPQGWTTDGFTLDWKNSLSDGDKTFIQNMYPH